MGNYNRPYRVPTAIYTYTRNGTNQTSSLKGSSVLMAKAEIKQGSPVPGYIDRIRAGVDASSYYFRSGFNVSPGLVTMQSEQRWGGQNILSLRKESFATLASLPNLAYNPSDVTLDASNRLKRKLREFSGQSNQLINLVELRELPKTIGTAANSAIKLLNAVAQSKRRGRNLKTWASEQWLNWSFGISPTLGAIDDLVESIGKYLARDNHAVRDYGVSSKVWRSRTLVESSGSHHYNIVAIGEFTHELSAKISSAHVFGLTSGENYSAQKHFGFDIASVVPTAWELLPYSWLIDYFTTAGSFIEDTFATDSGKALYLCQNVKLRVTGRVTYKPKAIITMTPLVLFVSQPLEFEYFEFTRTPLATLPRAPLRFKTANEVASFATAKLLNLASILGAKK